MAYPHLIRLRGPWEYEPLERYSAASTGDLPPPGRVDFPAAWAAALGSDFFGRVRFRRRFNRPTGLEQHERVWLVAEGVAGLIAVTLNDQPLVGLPEATFFDI